MKLNNLSIDERRAALTQSCGASAWVDQMLLMFPFVDEASLYVCADKIWQNLDEADYLEAFSAHPKIGDLESLQEKYAASLQVAAKEQAGMETADLDTLKLLAEGNRAYEHKFGFIFIVCATGKSATEILELLQSRLNNDYASEIINAAEEQRLIFHIRLKQLL